MAQHVGAVIAQRAKDAGIYKVVFDRNGYTYHGRIAALADSARPLVSIFNLVNWILALRGNGK